jgi:hypothetical protein
LSPLRQASKLSRQTTTAAAADIKTGKQAKQARQLLRQADSH